MMEAAAGGHKQVVQLLLDKGADPSIQNAYGLRTARDMAAAAHHDDVVELLDMWSSEKDRIRRWKETKKA